METLIEDSDELFKAIGMAVVRFQQVEQWLAQQLAIILRMHDKDAQHLVSAAMSFKQKADLVIELFPKHAATANANLPKIDLKEVRKALNVAEEYRNRVVHSFYGVECGDTERWVRIKGSLRARKGFSMNSVNTNIAIFQECNDALRIICAWRLHEPIVLREATLVISKHMKDQAF